MTSKTALGSNLREGQDFADPLSDPPLIGFIFSRIATSIHRYISPLQLYLTVVYYNCLKIGFYQTWILIYCHY